MGRSAGSGLLLLTRCDRMVHQFGYDKFTLRGRFMNTSPRIPGHFSREPAPIYLFL
jgi:hypothetical protein